VSRFPLGTGGPVKQAELLASDPSILVNGDTFFDVDLEALYRFHTEKAASVTLSLLQVEDVSRYGAVTTDEHGQVRGLRRENQGPAGPGLINGGVSMLSVDFIRSLPAARPFSMEQEISHLYAIPEGCSDWLSSGRSSTSAPRRATAISSCSQETADSVKAVKRVKKGNAGTRFLLIGFGFLSRREEMWC